MAKVGMRFVRFWNPDAHISFSIYIYILWYGLGLMSVLTYRRFFFFPFFFSLHFSPDCLRDWNYFIRWMRVLCRLGWRYGEWGRGGGVERGWHSHLKSGKRTQPWGSTQARFLSDTVIHSHDRAPTLLTNGKMVDLFCMLGGILLYMRYFGVCIKVHRWQCVSRWKWGIFLSNLCIYLDYGDGKRSIDDSRRWRWILNIELEWDREFGASFSIDPS